MAEIKFEIKETVGTLSQSLKGWTKELNLSMICVIGLLNMKKRGRASR